MMSQKKKKKAVRYKINTIRKIKNLNSVSACQRVDACWCLHIH